LQGGVSLGLCWPVSTIPGLLKVGNMSVGNKFKVTNPVYISHMIILTTADSSSLAYWLPSLLNAQCELHYFALVFLQLILDCHCESLAHGQAGGVGRHQGRLHLLPDGLVAGLGHTVAPAGTSSADPERQRLRREKKNARYPCNSCHNKDIHAALQAQSFECSWIHPCSKKEIPEIPQTVIPGKKRAASSDPGPQHCADRVEQRQGTPDGERADLVSVVHLSSYLMNPQETNQGIFLATVSGWV